MKFPVNAQPPNRCYPDLNKHSVNKRNRANIWRLSVSSIVPRLKTPSFPLFISILFSPFFHGAAEELALQEPYRSSLQSDKPL